MTDYDAMERNDVQEASELGTFDCARLCFGIVFLSLSLCVSLFSFELSFLDNLHRVKESSFNYFPSDNRARVNRARNERLV